MKLTTTLSGGRTVALTVLLASCLFACLFTTTAAGQQPPCRAATVRPSMRRAIRLAHGFDCHVLS